MNYQQYSKSLQSNTNFSRTANGAIEHKTSLDSCVDFFYATLEAPDSYYKKFLASLKQDRLITMKTLFFHRDIRGAGQGRRANFRYVLTKLDEWALATPEFSCNSIFEYGRYDDMLSLLNTQAAKDVLLWTKIQLEAENALVAKWLPREASSRPGYKFLAKRIAKFLGLSSKEYRKRVSTLTKVVETQMTSNDWNNIDYNKVPSQAILKYRSAFQRHSPKNFQTWLESLSTGEGDSKINVGTTLPHQIIHNYGSLSPRAEDEFLEQAWGSLPKIEVNSLVVADTSGSMCGMPMVVSLALALFLSERNPYGGFITFSERPSWHIFNKEDSLFDKIRSIDSINALNTNLEEVFTLLIDSYLETDMMPEQLVIISDMEFDSAIGATSRYRGDTIDKVTFFHKMKRKFKDIGAKFPQIIFWNVNGGSSGVPVTADETGTALISGFNPQFLNQLQNGEEFSPKTFMLQSIDNINPQI